MAKGLISPVSFRPSASSMRALIEPSAAKILATCNPARLKALLGEVQVTECRANSSESDAKGV